MINLTIENYNEIVIFWLVYIRWVTILFQLPIFDNMTVPMILKALFPLILSFAFYPTLSLEVAKDLAYVGIENFWILTIFYTLVGLTIGYLAKAIMSLFVSAGSIITQQVGFAAVRYFDPSTSTQIGPFEKIIQWTMIVIIISSGALLPMFKGIYQSFSTIHIYNIHNLGASPAFFLEMFKGIFVSSILLASPIIFTNLLITATLGIISRSVPQMNIIMVSFVVNIGLGLLVFAASSEEFFQVAFKLYTDKLGQWFHFVI